MSWLFRSMVLLIMALPAMADASPSAAALQDDDKAALKAKFEERYPRLERAKRQGLIGETSKGLVEFVDDGKRDDDVARLIEVENKDRHRLYELIAKEETRGDREVSPEQVGERNARRNFRKATPAEFLKTREGVWIQRKDVATLKSKGVVGETADGEIAFVNDEQGDKAQQALVAEENRIRREEYRIGARKDDSTPEKVAREAGRKAIREAKSGEYVRGSDGKWTRK